jgi:hypothetical protein
MIHVVVVVVFFVTLVLKVVFVVLILVEDAVIVYEWLIIWKIIQLHIITFTTWWYLDYRRVFILVDARRGIMQTDLDMMQILDQSFIPYQVS